MNEYIATENSTSIKDIGQALANEYKINYPDDIGDMWSAIYNDSNDKSVQGLYQNIESVGWPTDAMSLINMGTEAYYAFGNVGKEIGAVSRLYNKITGKGMYYDLGIPDAKTDTNDYIGQYNQKLQQSFEQNSGKMIKALQFGRPYSISNNRSSQQTAPNIQPFGDPSSMDTQVIGFPPHAIDF